MNLLFCIIFLGSDLYSSLFFYFKLNFVSFLFVWFRGTLPRFRYKMMYLAWRRFLPLSLNHLLFFFVGVRCFIFSENKQIKKNTL